MSVQESGLSLHPATIGWRVPWPDLAQLAARRRVTRAQSFRESTAAGGIDRCSRSRDGDAASSGSSQRRSHVREHFPDGCARLANLRRKWVVRLRCWESRRHLNYPGRSRPRFIAIV